MKRFCTGIAAAVSLLLACGCSKNADDSTSSGSTDGEKAFVERTLDSLKEQAGSMADQARSAAEDAVASAQETAEELAAVGKEKFEEATQN